MADEQGSQESGQGAGETLTPEQAQGKISEVMRTPGHPYHDLSGRYKNGHDEAVAEMQNWYKLAFPEGSRANELEPNRGLHDRLKQIGLDDPERIRLEGETGREALRDEAAHRTYLEAEGQLRQLWPSEQSYNEGIARVHFAIDQIVKDPAEREAIIERYGNDVQMCEALSIVVGKLDDLFFKGEARKYKRMEKK